MKAIFSILIFLAGFSLLSAQNVSVPDVDVDNIEGETIHLPEYAKSDHPKLINLWATWCAPCRKELQALSSVYDDWKENYGLEIVALSVDIPPMLANAKSMFKKNNWNFTFLHDKNGQSLQKLGVQGIPYSLLVDKNGDVISVSMGYTGDYIEKLQQKLKELK